MTTSNSTSPYRLVQIDESLRADHYYLNETDECYYLGEYQPRGGYTAGRVNQLIFNFKKPVSRRGQHDYRYKEQAIQEVGRMLARVLGENSAARATIVPIPPSKACDHPDYDDRLVRALHASGLQLDVRSLMKINASTQAHHEYADGERRPSPDVLKQNMSIDHSLLHIQPRASIVLFDDVLTTGSHFRACKDLLQAQFSGARIVGLFIGRSQRPDPAADFLAIDEVL